MWRRLWTWISRPDVAVTRLLGVLLVMCCLAFISLSSEVLEGETQDLDEQLVRMLRSHDDPLQPRGPWWLPVAARDVTALGGMPVLVLVVSAVCGYVVLLKRYRTLLLVLAATLGGALINTVLKRFFARPRPTVVPHLTEVISESFPSGHAMLSAIVYLTLGALLAQLAERRRLKAYVLSVALGLCFLVGLTRVYLGVHYPTDVLGGWIAGLAWALLTALVARAVRRRSPALRAEARQPVE